MNKLLAVQALVRYVASLWTKLLRLESSLLAGFIKKVSAKKQKVHDDAVALTKFIAKNEYRQQEYLDNMLDKVIANRNV